jgi:hypothetical protein
VHEPMIVMIVPITLTSDPLDPGGGGYHSSLRGDSYITLSSGVSTLRSSVRQGALPAARRAKSRGLDRRLRSG